MLYHCHDFVGGNVSEVFTYFSLLLTQGNCGHMGTSDISLIVVYDNHFMICVYVKHCETNIYNLFVSHIL